MNSTAVAPRLADEGVYFRIEAPGGERECLLSRNALSYLGRLHGNGADFMNVYRASETYIQAVARRLVDAGEKASPLVLGAAYFVGVRPPQ